MLAYPAPISALDLEGCRSSRGSGRILDFLEVNVAHLFWQKKLVTWK